MDQLLQSLHDITLPEALGRGESMKVSDKDPVAIVACIADLHGDPEVQKTIADIIEYLITHHNFALVTLEGLYEAETLRFSVEDVPYRRRWTSANRLLDKGYISTAIEYLAY